MATVKKFGREKIIAHALKLRGTGAGLVESLEMQSEDLVHGDRVRLVVDGDVIDVQYPKVKKADGVSRTVVLQLAEAVIVPATVGQEELDVIREKLQEKKDTDEGYDATFVEPGGLLEGEE